MKVEEDVRLLQGNFIQASGALVAFRPADDRIVLASANCRELLDAKIADELLGQHVRNILGSNIFHALRNAASLPSILRRREQMGQHTLYGKPLDISAFQSGELVFVEIVPADVDPIPAPYDALKDVLLFQDRILASTNDVELFQSIVVLLRTISGYDCVAACRYQEGQMHVVAGAGNALSSDVEIEVDTHFHMIPDIEERSAEIRTTLDIDRVDLSLSGLRCQSAASIANLRNIGATACTTQGIQIDQHLWGYLIFLHRMPRMMNHRTRLALAHLQQFISARLNSF